MPQVTKKNTAVDYKQLSQAALLFITCSKVPRHGHGASSSTLCLPIAFIELTQRKNYDYYHWVVDGVTCETRANIKLCVT